MDKRHLLSITDLEPDEISYLVDRTLQIATGKVKEARPLKDKAVGIYFRKTSTRTRTAFTLGAARLGASVITYGPNDLQINTGETIQDTTNVLSGFLDALVLRTAESLAEMQVFADQKKMSIINAMSDIEHPSQALADLATLKEHFGRLNGLHILYLGEGNSTAVSFAQAISKTQGMKLTLLTPEGYGLPSGIIEQTQASAHTYGAQIEEYHSNDDMPKNVDVVYTTRWQTTGSSKADPNWKMVFNPFSVSQALMDKVSKPSGTIFMHDLPAVRDEDVASEVLDGPQSIAFHQAHNKLFGAMAALEWCIVGY
ncbi:ornithine carbamoyltransferase [Ktedonobacteria bacterium brp13]|nr:ornithine carbamoyltransferase [Ktedonobacteria bacterium brp13]